MSGNNERGKPAQEVEAAIDQKVSIRGSLYVFEGAKGIVLFAHGSGSSRFSPRNRYVAGVLQQAGLATLLIDLLTKAEEIVDLETRKLRFDIDLLTARVIGATRWLLDNAQTSQLNIGYFGASTGAAAALVAAAECPAVVGAIVSRGGRPDLAEEALARVKAPTLLVVGGNDTTVISINRKAMEKLSTVKELAIVPAASHLFEEPGALEEVAQLAADWFGRYLAGGATSKTNDPKMQIDSYHFGSMTVNAKEYKTDLIIFPDRVKANWWRKQGHSLALEDLDEAIDYKPEVIVVGKGASGLMEIPLATKKALQEKQIELIDENTGQAWHLFNEQIRKGKKVVGLFHLTC